MLGRRIAGVIHQPWLVRGVAAGEPAKVPLKRAGSAAGVTASAAQARSRRVGEEPPRHTTAVEGNGCGRGSDILSVARLQTAAQQPPPAIGVTPSVGSAAAGARGCGRRRVGGCAPGDLAAFRKRRHRRRSRRLLLGAFSWRQAQPRWRRARPGPPRRLRLRGYHCQVPLQRHPRAASVPARAPQVPRESCVLCRRGRRRCLPASSTFTIGAYRRTPPAQSSSTSIMPRLLEAPGTPALSLRAAEKVAPIGPASGRGLPSHRCTSKLRG